MTNYTAQELADLEAAIIEALEAGIQMPWLTEVVRLTIPPSHLLVDMNVAATDQNVNYENDQKYGEHPTGPVTPASAMGPSREDTNKHHEQDDKKDSH